MLFCIKYCGTLILRLFKHTKNVCFHNDNGISSQDSKRPAGRLNRTCRVRNLLELIGVPFWGYWDDMGNRSFILPDLWYATDLCLHYAPYD